MLLGGEVPAAIHEAAVRARACPIQYLVIRGDSVPKVGTVPLLDLHFTLNISLHNKNILIS